MSEYDEDSIVLRDRVYIPTHTIDADRAEKKYIHYMYDNKACRRCDNRSEKHNYICDECPSFKGRVNTSKRVIKNGVEYLGLPIGDRSIMERKVGFDFDEYDIIDKRVDRKFRTNVKMKNFALRDYQKEALLEWWDFKHGLIVAPPRSGKTPSMLFLSVKLGLRTIVLAHQHDFLTQFVEHIEEFTNLPSLERKYKRKLFGFPKTKADFNNFEICVCTYQQFTSSTSGADRFRVASRNYGTLMIDEAHKANADKFAGVVNSWPSKIKAGVTATDKRKDGREILVREIIGPVVTRVEIPQLKAKVTIHPLDFVKPRSAYRGPAGWTYAMKFLSNHEKRNEFMFEMLLKDLAKGHSIVIPVYFRDHVDYLVKRINDLAGEGTAEAFVGGSGKKNKEQREMIIDRARKRKTKVVVGIRSLLQLGLNVPAWSAIYYFMPMSNEPNWKQESSRVLTPDDSGKKPTPIIRMFVDLHMSVALGCWANTYRQTLSFRHMPSSKNRELAAELLDLQGSGRGSVSYDSDPYGGGKAEKTLRNPNKRVGDDPYAEGTKKNKTLKHGLSPRERRLAEQKKPHKSLKDRANKNTPKGRFNR